MPAQKPKIEISTARVVHRTRVSNALRRPLALTRAGMVVERLTRSFWPFWSWMFAIWSALSFGVADHLSVELAYIGAVSGLSVALVLLVMGLRRFRWVRFDEALDRLDRSLPDRPLSAIMDRQSAGADDIASVGVWQAHIERMSARAMTARAVLPKIRLSQADPFALRHVAATALVIAVGFGSITEKGGLHDVFLAPNQTTATLSGPIYEGWIEPPRYTGLPTIYLNKAPQDVPLSVPVGSKVTLRLYGRNGDGKNGGMKVSETVSGAKPKADPANSGAPADFEIAKSGSLQIIGADGSAQGWRINVIPDRAPMIAFTGPIESTLQGEIKAPFSAADDYGIASGTVTIALDMPRLDRRYGLVREPEVTDPIVLDIPMPFNANTQEFSDVISENLSKHLWVGLPVTIRLRALDARDQVALAEPETLLLPGRHFFDPLAMAIVEQRRDLLWNRKNAPRAAMVLRAISNLPEDIFDNTKAFLMLRTAITRLEINLSPDVSKEVRDEVAELLWQAALQVEDGDLSDAEKRLRRAQERLSQALKNGATNDEIAKLSDELRKAMQDYLNQLAQNAEKNPDQQQAQNDNARQITAEQLQAMLDRIEELSRQGRTAEAQQLLEQLRQMMQNMRAARGKQGQGQGQGQQAMRSLQDTLRQQQGLSDDAFRKLQKQFNGQGGSDGLRDGGNLAGRQEALRELLDKQQKGLPDGQTKEGRAAREALKRAGRKMGAARDALRQGDIPGALDRQAEALDEMRKGIDGLGREMAKNQNPNMGRQGDQAGNPDPNSGRDPLGRQAGTLGRLGADKNILPGEDLFKRSRELVDEIRRRSGERSRPRLELDYLQRLLDRF